MNVPLIGMDFFGKWGFVPRKVFPLDENSLQRVFRLSESYCMWILTTLAINFDNLLALDAYSYSNPSVGWFPANNLRKFMIPVDWMWDWLRLAKYEETSSDASALCLTTQHASIKHYALCNCQGFRFKVWCTYVGTREDIGYTVDGSQAVLYYAKDENDGWISVMLGMLITSYQGFMLGHLKKAMRTWSLTRELMTEGIYGSEACATERNS